MSWGGGGSGSSCLCLRADGRVDGGRGLDAGGASDIVGGIDLIGMLSITRGGWGVTSGLRKPTALGTGGVYGFTGAGTGG